MRRDIDALLARTLTTLILVHDWSQACLATSSACELSNLVLDSLVSLELHCHNPQTRSLRHSVPDTHFPAFLEQHWEQPSDKAIGKGFLWKKEWNEIRLSLKMVLMLESIAVY